ncbi:MAG: hypothetical protein U0Q07_06965 [Acidimicrobiales bacterium]
MVQPGMVPMKKPPNGMVWAGLILLIVGVAAGIGFGVYGTTVIINDLQVLSGVRPGGTGSSQVTAAGCRDLYFFTDSGSLPSTTPTVTVKDPSGAEVTVSKAGCDATSTSSSASNFKVIGSFTAPSTGAYTLQVSSIPSGGATSRVAAGPPISEIAQKVILWFGLAVFFGGFLTLVGLTLLIVGLVRRSKAKRALAGPPPGAWGGPPGGHPPGGSYPPGPPGGGTYPQSGPPGGGTYPPGPPGGGHPPSGLPGAPGGVSGPAPGPAAPPVDPWKRNR